MPAITRADRTIARPARAFIIAALPVSIWRGLPERLGDRPDRQLEELEMLAALEKAIEERLTERQRTVFVAVALNEVPIDLVALRLDSNRGAIYKNLFDARRSLRRCLAEAGYPLAGDAEER